MQLFHLLYFSRKSPDFPDMVTADHEAFEAKNEQLGITGMLVESNGIYLQVIEGRRSDVSALLTSIFHDPRHSSITITRAAQIDERFFKDFRMNHIGKEAVPDEQLRLYFPDKVFDPASHTGSELWAFMADLV